MLPSAVVTVIVAEPGPLAVTKPLLLTVATEVLLDFQVTVLLLVLLGVTVAVSWSVWPVLSVAEVLFKVTPIANCLTVKAQVALLLLPSAVVTVMVADPGALAVTRPVVLTVATVVLLDFQVTALLEVLLGLTVAVSCKGDFHPGITLT